MSPPPPLHRNQRIRGGHVVWTPKHRNGLTIPGIKQCLLIEGEGKIFEDKVLDTTGPVALRRILPRYHNPNLQPSEKECLVYDIRGAGSSWKDPDSYHKEPSWKSVYVN